ncbi:beta-carotene 15,15'-monooxygenase, partial [Bifidobacteriaceae bacterium WP021]
MISTYASKTLPNTTNSANSRISNQTDNHCIKRALHFLRIPFIVIILITLFECSIGNLPFWSSVTGSTDSISAHNDIGSGIRRLDSGGILITDPSEAYLEVTSDGSSPYIRLEPAIIKKKSKNNNLISNINVLVEANKYLSKPQSTNTASLDPSLLKLPKQAVGKSCIVRVWLQ